MRDNELENDLQKRLDEGHNVWVIGDVHGFQETLLALLGSLELQEEDRIVLLGDLIDRGPDSFGVMDLAISDPRVHIVLGNHEAMMRDDFTPHEYELPENDARHWYLSGGLATIASYARSLGGVEEDSEKENLIQLFTRHIEWLREQPTHIVLDSYRLVHGGYDPRQSMDTQIEAVMLWIRDPFHQHHKPIDPQRTVLFGHTPTMMLPNYSEEPYGQVWFAPHTVKHGLASAIGLDTCVFHIDDEPALLSAFNLQDHRIIQQERVEPWGISERRRAQVF